MSEATAGAGTGAHRRERRWTLRRVSGVVRSVLLNITAVAGALCIAFTVSSDLLGAVTQTLLGSQLTTTQVSANHFTTRITTNVISGLLGAILSSFKVTAQTAVRSWTSAVSQPAKATHLVLLGPYKCAIG